MKKNLLIGSLLCSVFAVCFLGTSSTYALDCGNPPATGSYVYADNAKINTIIQKQIDVGLKNNATVYAKYKAEYAKIKKPTQRQKDYYNKLLYSLETYNGNIVKAFKKNNKNYIEVDFYSYATTPSNASTFCRALQYANQSKKTRIYEVPTAAKITLTLGVYSCQERKLENPNDTDPYYKKRCGKITFDEWMKFGCGKEGTVYHPNYMNSCVSDTTKGGTYEMKFTNGKVSSLTEGYSD